MERPEDQSSKKVGNGMKGADSSSDDAIVETSGARLVLIMVGLCLAVFLTGMASKFLPAGPQPAANTDHKGRTKPSWPQQRR